ncbi:MAG: hypothetical protein KKG02_03175 [Candidatus Edwardsbacteria bacterium]|nr:hypothetical protein [Candidatus Edwardsbacteria bacterium]
MNRINAIMVYAVIIIWAGVVLLHGTSGTGLNTGSTEKGQVSRIVTAKHVSPAPVLDRRLDSLTPLYY